MAVRTVKFSTAVGDSVSVHKSALREGENIVRLTAFGSTGGRLVLTSTLDVTKNGNLPTSPTPLPPPTPGKKQHTHTNPLLS